MANRNIKGDVNVEFNEASSRQGLDSGESVKTLFGKLRKWLSDLKPVAFSGSYSDLSNKPTIPTKSSLGLGNVDNTSDANKPISTAAQAEFNKQQAQIDYNTNQGVKNLCKITAESQTINGVTFTVDKVTGTITANGTANQLTFFAFKMQINDGKYILSGCPPTGSDSTYRIDIRDNSGGITFTDAVDYGTGSGEITLSGNKYLNIRIVSGYNCNNLVFKPMIHDASIEDNTFEPYAEPNYQLTQKVDRALEQTGYNLLEITADTQTINGVTFTVDKAAGTITANGTATSTIWSFILLTSKVFNEDVRVSGCPTGGNYTNTYSIQTDAVDGTTYYDFGSGFTFPQGKSMTLRIVIRSGYTCNNLVFKPMIVPSGLAGMPFQPYAMSNVELTQKVEDISDCLYIEAYNAGSVITIQNTSDFTLNLFNEYSVSDAIPKFAFLKLSGSGMTYYLRAMINVKLASPGATIDVSFIADGTTLYKFGWYMQSGTVSAPTITAKTLA